MAIAAAGNGSGSKSGGIGSVVGRAVGTGVQQFVKWATTPSYTPGSGYSYTNPNNDLTYRWMQEANQFNAQQAQLNRDWQERMSNTAYQRAMKDMEAAGLNPILAGNLGGASTPGGSAAQANFTSASPASYSFNSAGSYGNTPLGEAYQKVKSALANAIVDGAFSKNNNAQAKAAAAYYGSLQNSLVSNYKYNNTGKIKDAMSDVINAIKNHDMDTLWRDNYYSFRSNAASNAHLFDVPWRDYYRWHFD